MERIWQHPSDYDRHARGFCQVNFRIGLISTTTSNAGRHLGFLLQLDQKQLDQDFTAIQPPQQ